MDIQFLVQNVKRLLDMRGISYSRAGIESGAGIDFVRNMERKGTEPSIGKVMQMATYLGITVGELLGEEKEPTPIGLTAKEAVVLEKYRAKPELQPAVDILLGVDE